MKVRRSTTQSVSKTRSTKRSKRAESPEQDESEELVEDGYSPAEQRPGDTECVEDGEARSFPTIEAGLSARFLGTTRESSGLSGNLIQFVGEGQTSESLYFPHAISLSDALKDLSGHPSLEGLGEAELRVVLSHLQDGSLLESHSVTAQTVLLHQYGLGLLAQTKAVFRKFWPGLMREFPTKVQMLKAGKNNASHEWLRGEHVLRMELEPCGDEHLFELAKVPTRGSFGGEHVFRRGLCDLISFVHEYAHAIFDEILGQAASNDVGNVNRALSEGFAVLLELATIDKLLAEDAALRSGSDTKDLSERRAQRVSWLQRVLTEPVGASHMAYAEGTEIMAILYREKGVDGILKFVSRINPLKANSVSRSHPEYLAAIEEPLKLLTLLGA